MIPGARFTRVSGSGHLMQEDAPEAIVGELMNFLRLGEQHQIADNPGLKAERL